MLQQSPQGQRRTRDQIAVLADARGKRDWWALRCGPTRTYSLMRELEYNGFSCWTPMIEMRERDPVTRNSTSTIRPLLAGIVFVHCGYAEEAPNWREQFQGELDDIHELLGFSFYTKERLPVRMFDHDLDDLRAVERAGFKGVRLVTHKVGQSGAISGLAFAGLSFTITEVRGNDVIVKADNADLRLTVNAAMFTPA